MKKTILAVSTILAFILATAPAALAQKKGKKAKLETSSSRDTVEARNVEYLTKAIRKELVTIPTFGVFDWLEGNVEPDGTVYLRGEVVKPITKSDAEKRVKKLEGVERLESKIEVLPLSGFDDQLRARVYRTLFGQSSPLFRYGLGVNPSIHIIIKNGRCTLKGIVSSKGDSDLANIRARGVEGLFEVTNELKVEKSRKK